MVIGADIIQDALKSLIYLNWNPHWKQQQYLFSLAFILFIY